VIKSATKSQGEVRGGGVLSLRDTVEPRPRREHEGGGPSIGTGDRNRGWSYPGGELERRADQEESKRIWNRFWMSAIMSA